MAGEIVEVITVVVCLAAFYFSTTMVLMMQGWWVYPFLLIFYAGVYLHHSDPNGFIPFSMTSLTPYRGLPIYAQIILKSLPLCVMKIYLSLHFGLTRPSSERIFDALVRISQTPVKPADARDQGSKGDWRYLMQRERQNLAGGVHVKSSAPKAKPRPYSDQLKEQQELQQQGQSQQQDANNVPMGYTGTVPAMNYPSPSPVHTYISLIQSALTCSLFSDVLLEIPIVLSAVVVKESFFALGLIGSLFAAVFYILANHLSLDRIPTCTRFELKQPAVYVPVILCTVIAGILCYFLLPHAPPDLKPLLLVYIGVLHLLLSSSIHRYLLVPTYYSDIVCVAALVYIFTFGFISANVLIQPASRGKSFIMGMYYFVQYLFTMTVPWRAADRPGPSEGEKATLGASGSVSRHSNRKSSAPVAKVLSTGNGTKRIAARLSSSSSSSSTFSSSMGTTNAASSLRRTAAGTAAQAHAPGSTLSRDQERFSSSSSSSSTPSRIPGAAHESVRVYDENEEDEEDPPAYIHEDDENADTLAELRNEYPSDSWKEGRMER